MARWLVPLSVALLIVLCAHGLALWTINQQLQAFSSVIDAQTDPLFTRQITQQAPTDSAAKSAPIPSPEPAPALPPLASVAQPSIAIKPTPSAAKATPLQVTPATEPATESAIAALKLGTTATMADGRTVSIASTTDTLPATPTSTLAVAISSLPSSSTLALDPAASLALHGQWPSDTRLSYQLGGYFRGELHGEAQVQWTRLMPTDAAQTNTTAQQMVSDRYQVRVSISVGPLDALLTSQGRIRATGLQPEAYEEKLPNGSRRKVTLDAQDVILNDGKRIAKPQINAVQDTASQFVELGQRFSTGRARLAPGEVVNVWLARPGGLDEWTYDVGPAETVYLPALGAVQAYSLTPRPIANKRGTITAQMWMAPGLQNLPVRIKITLNSDTHVDLLVKKIEQR